MIENELEEIKNQIVALKSDLILMNYDIGQIRLQLDRIEYAVNNPPPAAPDPSQYTVVKL